MIPSIFSVKYETKSSAEGVGGCVKIFESNETVNCEQEIGNYGLGNDSMIAGTTKDPFKCTVRSFSHLQLPRCMFEVGRKLDIYRFVIWSNYYNEVTVQQRN